MNFFWKIVFVIIAAIFFLCRTKWCDLVFCLLWFIAVHCHGSFYFFCSRDVVCRWSYPLVPDTQTDEGGQIISHSRHNVYTSKDVMLAKYGERSLVLFIFYPLILVSIDMFFNFIFASFSTLQYTLSFYLLKKKTYYLVKWENKFRWQYIECWRSLINVKMSKISLFIGNIETLYIISSFIMMPLFILAEVVYWNRMCWLVEERELETIPE